jgi:hypothetical protein
MPHTAIRELLGRFRNSKSNAQPSRSLSRHSYKANAQPPRNLSRYSSNRAKT